MLRSYVEQNIELEKLCGKMPRKKIKRELKGLGEEYNEFYCEFVEQQGQRQRDETYKNEPKEQIEDVKDQLQSYKQFLQEIKKNPRSYKRLNSQKLSEIRPNTQTQNTRNSGVNLKKQKNPTVESKSVGKNDKKNRSNQQISSNWQSFLKNTSDFQPKINQYDFVAIDCEFVKSNNLQCLARLSLVNEKASTLFDAYVKPKNRITDYLTNISGITYHHIKNAKSENEVIEEAKKHMVNKIIIGHTLYKDLGVCGLTNWKGFKGKIDIADSKVYGQNGKKISLKNLSYKHLGENIQDGSHSSVEDARATMKLFLKSKLVLLKENKLIKN